MNPPILFAHRGGAAHGPENTLSTFRESIAAGLGGIESDVWLTKDGVPVLVHDERIGRRFRRMRVGDSLLGDLPDHIPTLEMLLDELGPFDHISLDLKDPGAIGATVDILRAAPHQVVGRAWLCHPDLDVLTGWRRRWPDLRLVHSTRLDRLGGGPERHGAALYERGIDAVNFRHDDWSGGLTALYHRFDRFCFGWDAQLERVAVELLDMGLDAVYGDHVGRLIDARRRVYG